MKFILLFLCIAYGNATAQTFKPAANPEKILRDLREASQAVTSIQASFTEEKHLSVLKEPERSSGVFLYKRNDKMRWEQKEPNRNVILINGDRLRVQEAGKEKNVGQAGRMAAQIKDLMISLVNGNFQQNKAFSQQCLESNDLYMIVLTPLNRRLQNVYSRITMVFPKNTLHLKELTFFEKNGDKNMMRFQNEKFNQSIEDSLFENL